MRMSTCFMFSAFTQPRCPNMVCIGDGNSSSAALSTLAILKSLRVTTCGKQCWVEGSALLPAVTSCDFYWWQFPFAGKGKQLRSSQGEPCQWHVLFWWDNRSGLRPHYSQRNHILAGANYCEKPPVPPQTKKHLAQFFHTNWIKNWG